MDRAQYRNRGHYITDGWARNTKETFRVLGRLIDKAGPPPHTRVLDVGCATGELIHHLRSVLPGASFTGVDVFADLLEEARRLQPDVEFANASALELPGAMDHSFDVVTAVGVISIFDDAELPVFLDNVLRVARPRGRVFLVGPLNEYGVDCVIRHRKRMRGELGDWETGWNVHSQQTLAELLEGRCRSWWLHDFEVPFDLEPREDPVRTWTIRTESRQRQLTNGLKLLLDLYFVEIER